MHASNKTNGVEMNKSLKEIAQNFKDRPIQNTIGWFIVLPIGIPFIIINFLLLSLIWFLRKIVMVIDKSRYVICYPIAMLISLVGKINK